MKTQIKMAFLVLVACQMMACDAENGDEELSGPGGKADGAVQVDTPMGLATHTQSIRGCVASFNDALLTAETSCDEDEQFDGVCDISQTQITDFTRDLTDCFAAANDDALNAMQDRAEPPLVEIALDWRSAGEAAAVLHQQSLDAGEGARVSFASRSESALTSLIAAYAQLDGANVAYERGELNYVGCRRPYNDAQAEISAETDGQVRSAMAAAAELELAACIVEIGTESAAAWGAGDLHLAIQAQAERLCDAIAQGNARCHADAAEVVSDVFLGGLGF